MSQEDIVQPLDTYNKALLSQVHPEQWNNPEPASLYNLVVIGAGSAGLVSAAGAAGLGARVAIIEKNLMGGDCLNMGCVPSKAMIHSSKVAAQRNGINSSETNEQKDAGFAAAMERMRKLRARISVNDSAERFQKMGVDVFFGHGQFAGPNTVEVLGKTLRFKKAVIASGARAAVPPVDGLNEAGFVTNETVFWLTRRPQRLAVVGGGPIGCELAQAFRRLGSEVDIIQKGAQFLPREDTDAAAILSEVLKQEGVRVWLNADLKKVTRTENVKALHIETEGKRHSITVDEILVAVGRVPNIEGLNLESAGVQYTKDGITVSDTLQTSNPNIYAAGDICLNTKFTHTADATARIVIQNALFGGTKKRSALTIPWCTYTNPEIAHVGMYEKEAQQKGIDVTTFTRYFHEVDRAILDDEENGFVKIHVKKGTDQILGATIVASHAGDMISEITLAMVANVGLGKIAHVIHPYPTQAEAIKQTADAYNRTRLTPFVKKLLGGWLSWSRRS